VDALVYSAVIGSAFLHAAWNALLKREKDHELAAAGMFVSCSMCAALAALPALPRAFPTLAAAGWAAGAGLFEAVYVVSLSRALARAPLGPVYTVSRGGALVFVWPISVLLLGEAISATAVAGSALIALGLATTSAGGRARAPLSGAGLALAALAAACIAGYHLCYKQSLALGSAPSAVFALSLGLAGPLNLLRIGGVRRRRLAAEVRRRPLFFAGSGAVMAGSFLIFLFALVNGGAGAVLTLRNTSILFAQLFAWSIGERPTRAGLTGAALVAAGAVLLGL
jgi:drug/metabolite transporter (DMT)-like permease